MFWGRKKKAIQEAEKIEALSFADAKEATRRAVFLNNYQKMTKDEADQRSLAEIFRVFRTEALRAGSAEGFSEAEIDRSISELCDADAERLKVASEEEFRLFVHESGEIVKRSLAALQL